MQIEIKEAAASAPPVAVAGASFFGLSLPEWAAMVTIAYTLVLMFVLIRREFFRKR